MSVRGRWRLVETPGYDRAVAGGYILFDEVGGEPASGDGWAELQDDGSLEGEICLINGDDIPFIARHSKTSSTAC